MPILIHDKRLPQEYINGLNEILPDIQLFPFSGIDNPESEQPYETISCHPDIYIFQADKKTLIHAPSVSDENLNFFEKNGIKLIKGEKDPGEVYPYSCRYNAIRIGDMILHNLRYSDRAILDFSQKKGLKLVDIKQGYTGCSVLKVDDTSIITADEGIAQIAESHELNVLLISGEGITLPGEKQGFMGGASGNLEDGRICILGDLDTHPEYLRIKDFLIEQGTKYVDLKNVDLYDAGRIIFV